MEPFFNTNLHVNGMPQIIHTDPHTPYDSKENLRRIGTPKREPKVELISPVIKNLVH
jgi:hypothetical protein